MTTEDLEEISQPRSLTGLAVLPGGGGWLRIVLAVACALTMLELWIPGQAGGQVFLQLLLMIGLCLWVVVRPGSAAPAVLLISALCVRIFAGAAVLDGSLIALVVLLPLVHQVAAISAVVPLRSNVYWAAVLPTAVRYLGAVLTTVLGLIGSHLLGWW